MSISGSPPSGKFPRREVFVAPFPPLPTDHEKRSGQAVVTWIAGASARKWYSVTGPAMRRYADRVGADFIVLEGYTRQPYPMANKFRVRHVFDEYGYDLVLYVDGDILLRDDCENFFQSVPDGRVAILDETPFYDYWMTARFRHEAAVLMASQGIEPTPEDLPAPKNAGFYLMPRQHCHAIRAFEKPFPLCYRNGATVEQTWFCTMLHRLDVPLHHLKFPEQHWLWYLDQHEASIDRASVLHFCGMTGQDEKRFDRLVAHAEAKQSDEPRVLDTLARFDRQMLLDHESPRRRSASASSFQSTLTNTDGTSRSSRLRFCPIRMASYSTALSKTRFFGT